MQLETGEPLEDILYVEKTNNNINGLKYKLFIPRAKNSFILTTPAAKSETRTEDEILNANYEKIRNKHTAVYERFDNEKKALDKKPIRQYITSLVNAKRDIEGTNNWERSNEECLWFQFTDKGDTTPRFYAIAPAISQGVVEKVSSQTNPTEKIKATKTVTKGPKRVSAAQAMRRMDKEAARQSLKEQKEAARDLIKTAKKAASIDKPPKPPTQDQIFEQRKLPSAFDLLYRDSDEEDYDSDDNNGTGFDDFSHIKKEGDFMKEMLNAGRQEEEEKKGGKIRKSRKIKKSKKTRTSRKTKKGRK